MGLIFRKEFTDYTALFLLLTTLCSSDKVSSQVFGVDEEVTDVALIVYSSALLQNNLVQVLGQMLQNPQVGTRLSWEQAAKLNWLQKNLISRRLSTLSMVPAAQRLLLTPTVIPPEEQLSLILHETCLNYWDDSIPIHKFKISSVLAALPKGLRKVNVFHLVSTVRCTNAASFLDVVFKRLKQGTVILSSPLLYGILHTYPFACILPDFQEALDYVSKEIIHKANILNDLYVRIPLQQNDLKTLLLDVLKFLVSYHSPLSQKAKLRIQIILSYLSTETCMYLYTYGLSVNTNYNLLFSALKDNDYPADVRDVKYTLVAALESKELDLRKYLVGFDPGLYSGDRLSLLLAYLQRLYISLPNAHPASAYVSTLLPYVKFKYIASKGGSYIPRTSLDIAVLLNAFNTIGELSEAKTEIYKALTNNIQWESMLHNFPYYEYTDPRSLLISMVQSILSHNRGYKLCHKLIMQYFLAKANNATQECLTNLLKNKHNETYDFANISKPIDIIKEGSMTNFSLSSMVVTYKPRNATITPNKYTIQNKNTTSKYPLSTTEMSFGKQRETQQIQEIKCKVDGTVDGKIKSIIDIFHYLEAEKKEVFPMHINIECTDSNQKKLYLSSSKHPECNTVTHLPAIIEPKAITAEKPFKLTVQHTKTYSLETTLFTVKEKDAKEITEITSAPTTTDEETTETVSFTVKEKDDKESTEITSASTTTDEEMTETVSFTVKEKDDKESTEITSASTTIDKEAISAIVSDNVPAESQTREPTTVASPIFSRLSGTPVEPKHKLGQKSTVPNMMDTVTLSTYETTYIPEESSLEGSDSKNIFHTLSTIRAKEIGLTTSKSMITTDETVLPTNPGQTEFITEVTIPFQTEITQNYESITAIPNILHTLKATKTNEFGTTYTSSSITTPAIKSKQAQTMKTGEHTVEPTVLDTTDTERNRQAITSKFSHTGTQPVSISTTSLPDTIKPFKPAQAAYTTEIPEWKAETKETSIPNEQIFTSVVQAASSPTKTSLQNALPTISSINIFINKTLNITECTTLPNVTYILTKLNISQESINIIENIILTPEARRALLKYFKFAETELPTEILIRLLSFIKYYADLNTMAINIINDVLYEINAHSSAINESMEIINICMDAAGVIQILPSTTPKTPQELSWTTGYKTLYVKTAKEVVQTVAEEATTHTEEISTSVPKTTAGMMKHKPLTVTIKPLELSSTKHYEIVTTKFVPQPQKTSSSVTEETPVSPTLGLVSFPTITEQVNKTLNIIECIKVPNITSLQTAIPHVSRDSISIIINNLLEPELLVPLKQFRFTETESPVIAITRFLNFIKYYTDPSPMVIRAIDDILADININTYPGKLILNFIKICITEEGKMEILLPSMSSLEPFKDNFSISGYQIPETSHGNVTLAKSEDTSISVTLPTEAFTKHLQENTLPVISNTKLSINKTSSIIECIKLPNVTYLLTRLHAQESVFLIENIILTPKVLLALKHFKFVENESPRVVLIRLLNFVKYYTKLNTLDIRTIDEILSKINLVSSFKNEPLRIMNICMDTAGVAEIVTSLKPKTLSLTTDSAAVNMFTGKEVMQTVTLGAIPQKGYISASIPEISRTLEEMSPTTSIEPQALTLKTDHKTPDVTTEKETQTPAEEATTQTKELSTSGPKMTLTTTSSDFTSTSPEFSMITGYTITPTNAEEAVVQTVTEKDIQQMEPTSISIPEITNRTVDEMLSFFTKPLRHTANVTTDKEVVQTETEDTMTHTEEISTSIPETTEGIAGEMSPTSKKLQEISLTTNYRAVNVIPHKEVVSTGTKDATTYTEKISTYISETTEGIMDEMSPTSTKPWELSLATGYKAVNVNTDKEVVSTVTEDAMIYTGKISTYIPETTARIVDEMLPTSIKPQELSLTTGNKAVNVIIDKDVVSTVTEDSVIHTEKTSTSIPEKTEAIVDEMSPTSTKTQELSLIAGYKAVNVITDKEVTEEAMIHIENISTTVPETTEGIVDEMSPTSTKPRDHSLTTGYKAVHVITDKEVDATVTEEAMIHIENISTTVPKTTEGIVDEMSPTSTKPRDHSLTTGYKAVHVITEKDVDATVTEETMIHAEKTSTSILETTATTVDEMSPTSTKPWEFSLTSGYKTLNVITDKDIISTGTKDALIHTEKISTSIPETTEGIVDEISPISIKPWELSPTTGYKAVHVITGKEVVSTVTEDSMIHSEKISTYIPETTARIVDEMLPTSIKPQELSLTTDYKAVHVITDKEVDATVTEHAVIHTGKKSTSIPETTEAIVAEMSSTSTKTPVIKELSLITDYKAVNMIPGEKVVSTVTEDALIYTEKISTSVPETTEGIVDEMSPTSIKPQELSLTAGYKAVNVIIDKEVVFTVTNNSMIHNEKISTSIPETTARVVDEMSPTSTKPWELSLTSDYKTVNVITDKEVVSTGTEGVVIHTEKTSTSIPEMTQAIVDDMMPTSTKPRELSLTSGYKTMNVITYKEGVSTVTEDALLHTEKISTSVPEITEGIVDEKSPTSTKPLELSLAIGYEAATRETTPQSEQITNSVMEFTDTSPSSTLASLPTVAELMNKATNIVDCIKLPDISFLLTIIPPASREPLSLFLKYILQPEFLEPLKQFKFMEKEAPVQVLTKFLKFIQLYTEPSPKLLSAIDDSLLYINNNINSVPLNIMKICINKEGAVETIWTVTSPMKPTKVLGIDLTEHFHASPTSTMESSFNFTGQYQMDTTDSPTFHIHTDTIANIQRSPTAEVVTNIETTTTQFSTEWDENEIIAADDKLATQQHKSSTSTEGLQITETLTSTTVYPETEKITNANIKLANHSVTSQSLQTARKATEVKAITASVPKYQGTMERAELDILTTTESDRKTLETVTLKQPSLESQTLPSITTTAKDLISSATGTIKSNIETTIPNADITATSSIHLGTSTAALSATVIITETGSLGETIYKPLTTDTPKTEVYSIRMPSMAEIAETVTISTITEIPEEATEQTWLTKVHVTEAVAESISVTEMPHITEAAMGSTHKTEDGGWTMEMTSAHSEIMSTGMAVIQGLTETTTQPAKGEITKIPIEETVIKEETNESTDAMDHFSLPANTKVTPYEKEQHWTTSPFTTSEAVTQKSSLTLSNGIYPISKLSSSIKTVTTTEVILSSKIICITENHTLPNNIQQMNETNITLECIKIPDISLLLKANEHLSQDLLNSLSRILCRTNMLSLLKGFEIPESSTAANAMRRFLIFLKYNVEPDIQTTEVINEIMKNIQYDSLGPSGVVTNEICFSPPVPAQAFTFSPKYSKAKSLPTEVSSEMTDILHNSTSEYEQTTPSATSPFMPLDSGNAIEHAKTRYDHTSTSMLPTEKLTESSMSTYLETEQTFAPHTNNGTSKSINTDITIAIDSSSSLSFASPVSTSKKSTLSLLHVASTSVPTQSDEDEFHRPTLPNLTNIIHNKERKAYTIYPYVIDHQSSASWYYDGNIIVPKDCPHENMTHMLVIDVTSLFEVLDSQIPNKSLKHLIEVISTPETERELRILDWTRYNNKHTFLKDVLTFLIINSTHIEDIKDELISALHHIRPNSDDELPTFKFICIPSAHFPTNKSSEYKDVSVLKITTKEHCNASNSYNVVISIPTGPLFKCIDYHVPRVVKATIMALLSRDGISSLLSHFNALHYKTNGELLHALLTHLSYTPSLEDNVLQSIRILLSFTKFDGCGALAPTLTTECINTNEIEDMGYISTVEVNVIEHKQIVIPEAYTVAKITKHSLGLQLEECTENTTHMFVIDVPALFQAVKPEVGSNLQKNVMNILDRPEMQIKLKELPWERYVTKAEFLSDVLLYIMSKSTSNELSQAIKKIASNIQYDGPGTEPPMFKFICVDFAKMYLNEMEEQTPYVVIPTAAECNDSSNAVLLINIDSLLQAVKQEASPLMKVTALAFFQRKDFYTKISELKFENSTSSGMALKKILTHLVAKGELETPILGPVKEMLKHIQLDGPGARQLEIRKKCQSADFSSFWDDLSSNEEEKKMIIPFQCNDKSTLSGRFTVDIPSLFLRINTPTIIKFVDQIIEYFKTFRGKQLLAEFKWEVYETRGQMLKHLLPLVESTISDDDDTYVAIQKLAPLLDAEDSGSLPLVLKFECDANVADTIKEGNPYCENNSTSLRVVNITSLFKALSNDTPEMPKQFLSSYLSRLDVYKDLLGFNVHAYNTKRELLWKLLTYIMLQNSLNSKLHRAAAELVTHINWDGPGMEKIDASIVCNITSEVLHIDFSGKNINLNQEKSIIKISSQCHENGTMDIIDVDATSLVNILPKIIRNKMYNVSDLLNSSRIKNKLKEFKWDIHHETKSELLKEIVTMLFKAIPLEGNILNQVDRYIHKMNNIIETAVPLLSYRCINSRENYSHIAVNMTQAKHVHEIIGGLAIMQPTYGKCPNENNNSAIPIIVVNIANLFKALKPNTSVLAKAIIISHMTQTEFYEKITGFNLEAYKTRGEQLQQLLAFLATTTSDPVLLKSIDKLLQNILLDGPGQLPSVYRIVCNTSLNQLIGSTRRSNGSSEIIDILGAETENVPYNFSVLEPCIEGPSGITYKINIPSLFYALKSEAPQESLAKLATFIAKPSFQIQLKSFDAIHHKTQGSLLHAMLTFISKKAVTPSYVVQAVEDILPFVHSVALGKKTPKLILNCPLLNFQETTYDKQALDTFPEQGINIVNQEGFPCNYITSDSQIIKGRTVYIFDLPSIINIIAVADHEKKLIMTLFKSPSFQEHLKMSDFRFSTNNVKTLENLLLLLQENLNLQKNEIEIVRNMISKVRDIQETHISPVLIMKCTTDTSLKEFPAEATNQTCFLPLQYNHTGIAYDLQWDSLLEAMSPQTPSKLLRKLERFLNVTHQKIHLEGFNIFQYRTRGALLKDLLVFLALKPSLNLEYKKLMSSLVPYVQLHGMGSFAPTVISDCPKSDTQYVTETTDSATEVLYTTTLSDPCFSDPNSIFINQFDVTSLFTTLDKEAPSHSVSVINNYLQDDDIQEKLHGFDVKKYETKNDLLQGLLAFVWSDQNSPEIEKAAAKTLLPHIMFNVTEEPPILKTACYVPKKFYIRYVDDIPKSLTLVYPTEKVCLHNVAHIPGIIVYRITISTLLKALHPKLQVKEYLPVANFLSKPYAYKYVQGINIERYQTRGELLRAVLTFLRFSQKYMEDEVKDALVKMLPLIQLDGLGNLPVDKYTECSLVLEEDKSSSLQLQNALKAIEQTSLNAESHDAYLTIFDFVTSPSFNLTYYISWLDEKRTLTNGELLKIILLQIYDNNPNMGRAAMLLIPHVEEQKGIGGKKAKIETYRYKEMVTPYEINFLDLLKVIKPEAPKRAVSYVFNLFGKQNIYKDLKHFDPDEYENQGKLLVGILKFLEVKYTTNSTISTHVKELIPFVDMTNIGALPPIVKTIYITFNTSVSVFRLDLAMLYKLFPKEKLTYKQQQAMDEIFKFLSTKGYKLTELFEGLSSRFPSQTQIKLILEKLKLIAEEHLKAYANEMLQVLEENMPHYSSQDELIPEMDWIEVLHAIPDSDVPSEVTASKKELYRFFLSTSFKTIIKNYRVNLSINRGKFLKDLLSYLRSKPDISNIKVLKRAIAFVFMFIREVGAGAMPVQDDIILPEQQEEARSARNRIKELLYQVLGVIQQEGAFEILQTLQRLFDSTTKLNLVTTYLGYDVLEEFPPKERLITILRRIYHNFIMFLDQDTISAIDMVFISLGETKQQTSEILHFLPVDMETLLKTVLGLDTPPLVVAASDFIRSNINLNTIPLGKAFQDTVPSILNLDVRKRLTVILRILWRVFSKYDDAKIHQSIKTVYEYLQPNKLGNELSTQEHHTAVIATLKGLIRPNSPKKVQNAKNIVIEQLVNQQNVYDKVLAYLVTQNLSPKYLIAKALRRFREHQLKMNPKLWSAVSVIFDYLHIPEHESLEEETETNINIVDDFKYLVDEAGIEVAPAKRILMKYIIDKKPKLHKLFRAQHILLQYPQAEKMAIVLNRLLRIYGETLEPEIFSAASIILNHLDVLVNEVDINEININEIFNTVINETAPKNVIKAKRVIQEMLNNVTVLYQVLETVIIQKDFTPEHQLVTILRQFYNTYKPQLQKTKLQFLTTLFDYLKVSLDSSVEDQFIGNFTFKLIFKHIFPEDEVPEYVTKAVNAILGLLSSEQVDIKQLLYGVHLWKLPVVSQVSIILYRLTKIPYLNKEVRDSIDTVLEGLGIDLDELASEDIDESYTPSKLFNEAIGNRSTLPDVQEAKGILVRFLLSGSSKVKNVYRGIDFKNIPEPKDRLVAVLKNMYNKMNTFGEKMTEALDVISNFLHVDLGKQKIDPYTFDFDGTLEEVVPISAPLSVRQARNLFLKAVKNRPGTFKKILDDVNVTDFETENEIVSKILNAIQHYNRPLSKHLRIATNLILDYLHGVPIKGEISSSNDYNPKEDAEAEEDAIGFRMFEDEFKPKRKWKIKKQLRRYD